MLLGGGIRGGICVVTTTQQGGVNAKGKRLSPTVWGLIAFVSQITPFSSCDCPISDNCLEFAPNQYLIVRCIGANC